MKVIKRDGRKSDYNEDKVRNAIEKAFSSAERTDTEKCSLLAQQVTTELIKIGSEEYHIEYIQDLVEKTLIHNDLPDVATNYILYRANRTRIREMNSAIMQQMHDLTFGSSTDVELKRENGNIDGNTAMGTMLRYGSEVAKAFNFNYLVSPDIAKAHKQGDIHIHDADFLALTETCLTPDIHIAIQEKDQIKYVTMQYFDKYFNKDEEGVKQVRGIKIKEKNDTFVKVKNCARHKIKPEEKVYWVKLRTVDIKATGEHRVPIIENKKEKFIHIKDLKVGMFMLRSRNGATFTEPVNSIQEIVYTGYVYDIETETNLFLANGVVVHNCCQIDLERLFKGGFNTGHGCIREPSEIRSYSALACIALQSNQNEQH